MLPSSHLLLGESPEDASKRILREQLGLDQQPLEGPMVFSEVYGVDRTGENAHWDIEFIYLGERAEVPKCGVWKELTFLDLATAKRDVIARGHEDILSHAGRNVRA
jgi:ADP-ribose pyrophosphatase YjhB (NUDIX family)